MRGLIGTMVRPRAATSLDLLRSFFAQPSASGENVTIDSALRVSTVLDCVRVLAEGVSQVDLRIMKRRADGGADPATEHALYWPLFLQPNPWQSSFRFRETLMMHVALAGNFFAFKNLVRGRIVELIPFEPGQVTVDRRDDWSLVYTVRAPDGAVEEFPEASIWHVRGPSWNGWMGLEAVKLAREAIGLAMAAESTQAKLHRNSLRTSGLYSLEGRLDENSYKRLRAFIENHLTGAEQFKPFILDRGAKFHPTAMSGVDSQHLETRRHQVEEICRQFRVMPVMVGHPADMAARAAMEQIFIAHVVHTLMPWYRRLEQDIAVGLMEPRDRRIYFADFDEHGLMRGALKDQAEYFSKALGAGGGRGWLTQNDVRRIVGENPLADGDELPQPTNQPQPNNQPAPENEEPMP